MQCIHQYFWGVIHRFSLVCVLCAKMLQNLVSPFGIKNLTLLEKCPLNELCWVTILPCHRAMFLTC